MADANKSVFGIFTTRSQVESAVDALQAAGFANSDISVLFAETSGTKDFAMEKGTKAPEGATTGGVGGAVLGGGLGWLVGIGSLAIPGVGPFIAAGPIMAALAGASIGGAVGGIAGALAGMEIPEYEAKRYEGMVREGGILLSVHCVANSMIKKAEEIFKANGAQGVDSRGETTPPAPKGGRKPTIERSAGLSH